MNNLLNGLFNWVNDRLPIQRAWDTHMGKYYAPKNFNFWYFFGVFSIVVLVNQLLTGIWLTMNYVPSAAEAFASVEYIMRDVPYGDTLRYLHSTGASAFFIVVYMHMFRGIMYGSYRAPRELVWIFGMVIYIALMAEAFLGYVLPWGQMSYWGAQVIVSLFGAIPFIGEDLVQWIRGDYLISGATLNRFFALHVVAIPIVLLGLIVMHILALHEVGSNNPDGVDIKKHKDENGVPLDGVAFHPYYTVHDLMGISVFLIAFCAVVFFAPEMGGYFLEHANFEVANGLKTPEHIAPVWYFTPFYAVLRAVTFDLGGVFTAKLLGFIAMGAAIVLLFFLPWLDKANARSIRYKGFVPKVMLMMFAASFVVLGKLGLDAPTVDRTILAQVGTLFYFVFFLTMPAWSNPEKRSFVGSFFAVALGLWISYVGIAGFHHMMLAPKEGASIGTVSLITFAVMATINLAILFVVPIRDKAIFALKGFSVVVVSVVNIAVIFLLTLILQSSFGFEAAQGHGVNWFVIMYSFILGAFVTLLPALGSMDKEKPVPERTQAKGLSKVLVFGGLLLFILLTVLPLKAVAAGGGGCGTVPCEPFKSDVTNKESLQKGAKLFANYCMGCHSLNYSRYGRVADDLDIPHDLMLENLVFANKKIGELMTIAMQPEDSKKWFGAAPPDLTLVTRARSSVWVYNFLLNYYEDPSRPTGVNNKVFVNVGMPHVLGELQGIPKCSPGPKRDSHGKVVRNDLGEPIDVKCGSLKVGDQKGELNEQEYEQAVYNIVNFLTYTAEPGAEKRKRTGIFVLLFLSLLLLVTWLLNREYWKDIH